jgi:ubiquinone/menaquinone biosynthesis C-methylase UbiE
VAKKVEKMGSDIERWLKEDGQKVLKEIGIREGQVILDFGCGSGIYSLPSAKIIGAKGKIYALDKNEPELDELMRKAKSKNLRNIKIVKTSGDLKIPLEEDSVDMVLLYDVLHSYYFSVEERRKLLKEVHRVLKPNALLSVYPEHMSSEEIKREIEEANFHFEAEYLETIIHDSRYTRGHILNFRRSVNKRMMLSYLFGNERGG